MGVAGQVPQSDHLLVQVLHHILRHVEDGVTSIMPSLTVVSNDDRVAASSETSCVCCHGL